MFRLDKVLFRVLVFILALSVTVTELLLIVQGRWREAFPLHLCSLSAIAAAMLCLDPGQTLLDFLWYLGMPGAALALVFPAPASSICQTMLDASYYATHTLILVVPVCRMALGMRPRAGRTRQMMFSLIGIAAAACVVNRLFGTNFLFLMLPPAGTPLESVFSLGYPIYLTALFVLMALCCLAMDALAKRLFDQKRK